MAENTLRTRKRSDPRELARFIEEIGWLLKTHENLDFSALADFSHEVDFLLTRNRHSLVSKGSRTQTSVLVGVLPEFFMDPILFPANEDIVEFAFAALGMEVGRWQKKSRYEIIGQVVCHANEASPARIARLSDLLEVVVDKRTKIRREIEVDRMDGRSWSSVIKRLFNEF